ncbi:hypothetical protein BKA59DRAFT_456063 [Fusarium tricinctum]|uniref:Uncharacterized protein n=1 Tax=Fusarium tricinctum TaxID=61284 RepID=A0A8K0RST2_9HYPO|nr:hypothetical protein BKA59DRAFT_456063 [Fusarium tricinctum]
MSVLSSHVRDAPAVFALSLLNRRILNIPKSPSRSSFSSLHRPSCQRCPLDTRSARYRRRDRREVLRRIRLDAYRARTQAWFLCELASRGEATLQQWQHGLALWQEAQAWIVWVRRQLADL